ncbi:hypothetical protein K461DRAFT_280529 [Myriangium duriaei CBS 260.36]|uniref:Uncharacterized protein n=1 Tax=Myriangium duriaei CBS 260.36 TaxID=1168546 RepID=A0A9P4IZ86_9PEZI|nr:hypothetical protein K461DRAFT_280529 [Myriangium duriaei CBS 260.36]
MSKTVDAFWAKWASPDKLLKRISNRTPTPGSRVLPVNKNDDAASQFRIDAGEKIGDRQNLVLQVNSQAKSPALKKFLAENGHSSHGKLAVGSFDTKAKDPREEIERLAADMKAQMKSKIG